MIYTLDEIKQHIIPVVQKYDISALYVFGSYARREASEDSDIDLLIDVPNIKNLLVLSGIYQDLEEALGKKIDLITFRALSANNDLSFVENVRRDMVILYDRNREGQTDNRTHPVAL